MTEEQRKAILELIRVARVSAFTAAGISGLTKRDSPAEAAILDLETRLREAAEAAHQAIHAEPDSQATNILH